MPIRAQCDNCGKVYNLPDESAGKRLRCKQCAVAFTVPSLSAPAAAAAPTVSVTVPAVQKVCVVCGMDVAGKPRTKDQSGNYYCRACYEEKARSREQLAASPVGAGVGGDVGAGDPGEGGDVIDLSALEPTEEQFDESTQPPPPPIPDMDMVSEPIPDMEPPVLEAPKPKKKKKKPVAGAKGKSAKAQSGNSLATTLMALPLELYIIGVAVIIGGAGMISSTLAGFAAMGLVLIGLGVGFWGQICIVLAAFAEGVITGILYLFVPFYWVIFLMTNWDDVRRHVLRTAMGVVLIIGGAIVMARHGGDSGDGDADETPRARSRVARAHADDESAATKEETSTPRSETPIARIETPTSAPATQSTAPPPTPPEELVKVFVRFTYMLANGRIVDGIFGDPEDIDKRREGIVDAILTSLEQRGLMPPEGQTWRVEAVIEPGFSQTQKIKMANDTEAAAPILLLKMRVKDSVGRGNYIFDMVRTIELPADVITRASKSRISRFDEVEWIDEALWKNLNGEFRKLADQFKPEGAGSPASANPPAGAAKPAESAAPAK